MHIITASIVKNYMKSILAPPPIHLKPFFGQHYKKKFFFLPKFEIEKGRPDSCMIDGKKTYLKCNNLGQHFKKVLETLLQLRENCMEKCIKCMEHNLCYLIKNYS